jgi:hypothetical protein
MFEEYAQFLPIAEKNSMLMLRSGRVPGLAKAIQLSCEEKPSLWILLLEVSDR